MDNHRPGLDITLFHNICLDKNIPIILLFIKYDAFRRNVQIDLNPEEEAHDLEDLQCRAHHKCQDIFEAQHLSQVDETPFVQLEGMDKPSQSCDELVKAAMEALNPAAAVGPMLLTGQKECAGMDEGAAD
ncbi:hypothetical protein B0H17DRAFT_1152003 [Mycena rosella]|uniref:Uncharacterized protein n=1 Tax=Mycena rosella TaxID=1033263 RepID=A0AAD7BHF3_MYCRO|nr:hypothetical protein B0H17DRAFT_1152003 [Mycena rosella]